MSRRIVGGGLWRANPRVRAHAAASNPVAAGTKPHDFVHYLAGRYWWNHATVGSITCRNGSPAYTS
jgi:hypothetical protein